MERIGRDVRTVVLLEGRSDRAAVHALAVASGVDLARRGVAVVAMGGVTNVGRHLGRYGVAGAGLRVAGLCDEAEVPVVARALAAHGYAGDGLDGIDALAAAGFQVCVADLEDELVRAVGVARFERVVAEQGELRALRSMQQQPAQRDRPVTAQLRRWLGSGGSRKVRYAELLVQALEPDRAPAPLRALLDSL